MKIAVLLSGGVDSSVALKLLREQGHDVTAFYLKIWLEDELSFLGNCPWEDDLQFVRAVCEQEGVLLEVVPLQKEYHDKIVSYVIDQVKHGATPNPDVFCNRRIKFGAFLDILDKRYPGQFDKIASGHYAQIEKKDGIYRLVQAPDAVKDQTYFLSYLSQQQLSRLLFPIGQCTKKEVRNFAQKFNLPNKNRKDSQGICFLGKLKFDEFLRHYLGTKKGDLIEYETGDKVGEHEGFWYYTLGQRKGIGLSGGPWYVVQKDIDANRVFVSRNYFAPELKRDSFTITDFNWIGERLSENIECSIKLRHGPHKYKCTVSISDSNTLQVALHERDQGIAPGQFAVLYIGTECIGSGIITN